MSRDIKINLWGTSSSFALIQIPECMYFACPYGFEVVGTILA
jgi:hypothetical protein